MIIELYERANLGNYFKIIDETNNISLFVSQLGAPHARTHTIGEAFLTPKLLEQFSFDFDCD